MHATLLGMTNTNARASGRAPKAASQKWPTASAVLPDGSILEMVHDPVACTTGFVLSKHGDHAVVPDHALPDGRILVPFSPLNNLLTHEVVLFPSAPDEYGSRDNLLNSILDFIHRYCDLSPLFEQIAAHYVLLSWLGDTFNELPYLRVMGPPGCGKTRFLLTVGSICFKPILASGASTVSPLFRILDSMHGTLVLDEADFRFSDEKADVIKILNHGTVRGFPVLRAEQNATTKEFNPYAYHVFGPKLIATRNGFDDPALESRFISERLGTQRLRDDIPISLGPEHGAEARRLRNQLLLFRLHHRAQPPVAPAPDRSLEPRLLQTFGPLLAVIDSPELRRQILGFAHECQSLLVVDRGLALEGRLLEVIRDLGEEPGPPPTVKDIASAFAARYAGDVQSRSPRLGSACSSATGSAS